jgi:DNA-binding transcriptional regulator YiaG
MPIWRKIRIYVAWSQLSLEERELKREIDRVIRQQIQANLTPEHVQQMTETNGSQDQEARSNLTPEQLIQNWESNRIQQE